MSKKVTLTFPGCQPQEAWTQNEAQHLPEKIAVLENLRKHIQYHPWRFLEYQIYACSEQHPRMSQKVEQQDPCTL